MPIYTKKGDKGQTRTFSGKEVSKDVLEIEILGTLDEANSLLGLSKSFLEEKFLINKISQVQGALFKLGSIIAGAKLSIPKSVIVRYEKEIDAWTRILPPLKNFILPGGLPAGASLYTARTVVRRLERLLVKLNKERPLNPNILMFINRLSDYLFTLARYINYRGLKSEAIWKINK